MTVNSFTTKQLRFTLTLNPEDANAVFPGTGSNTLTLTGLRATANVQTVVGFPTNAAITIYGMKQDFMNALTTTVFNSQTIAKNTVTVEANDGSGWSLVFAGDIIEAFPQYDGMPAVYFNIQAVGAYIAGITPVPPLSYSGSTSVADIAKTLASQLGVTLETTSLTAQLNTPYLAGSSYDQLKQICDAAGMAFVLDGKTLALYPRTATRAALPMVELTPQSGLLGYPQLTKQGLVFRALFNANIKGGCKVRISGSDVPVANGTWTPVLVNHQLEAVKPGGQWFSICTAPPVQS